MTDLSKSMAADDNQALRLVIAMLHFLSIFIKNKHLRSLGFSPPDCKSCLLVWVDFDSSRAKSVV